MKNVLLLTTPSSYRLDAVSLRQRFTDLARGGPLTEFENRLVSAWGGLDRPRLTPISHIGGKGVDAYRLETGTTGRHETRWFTRTGEMLGGGVSESALVNEGLGLIDWVGGFRLAFGMARRGISGLARLRGSGGTVSSSAAIADDAMVAGKVSAEKGPWLPSKNRFLAKLGFKRSFYIDVKVWINPRLSRQLRRETIAHDYKHYDQYVDMPNFMRAQRMTFFGAFPAYASEIAAYRAGARALGGSMWRVPIDAWRSVAHVNKLHAASLIVSGAWVTGNLGYDAYKLYDTLSD